MTPRRLAVVLPALLAAVAAGGFLAKGISLGNPAAAENAPRAVRAWKDAGPFADADEALKKTLAAAPKTGAAWSIPITIDGPLGFVRQGVPFPEGTLRPEDPVSFADGSPVATEVLARWWDGSVKWLLVEALAASKQTMLTSGAPGPGPQAAPLHLNANDLVLTVNGQAVDLSTAQWKVERQTPLSVRQQASGKLAMGIVWKARLESYADGGPDRLRLELWNPTPTTENDGQPTCMTLGCPGSLPLQQVEVTSASHAVRVRWSEENGASATAGGMKLMPQAMELRPGEQYGWEIVLGEGDMEPAIMEFPAAWGCASRAFGPMVPMSLDRFGDYEQNNIAGARGLKDNRNRPHWRNPRDHGEDQRDWDGGVLETDFQTHNNEYEVLLAYAKQRVRTMGLHETSQTWQYLGVTGSRHFANVDIYHMHDGPLPFMQGAAFQHTRHGGSGQGDQHRSSYAPNMAHQTCRGLLAWYYLTGDPLLLESFCEVLENTRWRVINGPGMPGISGVQGEERAPANAIGILSDGWAHSGSPGVLAAANKAVLECHAKTKNYVNQSGEYKAKPWMISLLVVALDEFVDNLQQAGRTADASAAKESAGLYKTYLNRVVVSGPDMVHMPYQLSNDPGQNVDDFRDSWNVVAADALVDYFPDVAFALFRSGSHVIWHAKNPVGQYAKLLNHTVMSGWGHRTMAAMSAQPETETSAAAGSR